MMAGTAGRQERAAGLLGPWAGGFSLWLNAQGFAPGTVDTYVRWLGWLSIWLEARGLGVAAVSGPVAEEFAAEMRAAGHPKITAGRLAVIMCYLRGAGVIPAGEESDPAAGGPRHQLLAAYRGYLSDGRRLAPATVTERVRVAGLFLEGLGCTRATAGAVPQPSPQQVLAVVSSWGPLARRRCSPLRSFLRFLFLAGHTGRDLAVVIPPARKTGPSRQAARLTADEARAVLDSCTGTGERGCRDRAVLLLVARLALRACEVCRLGLDDIRWRSGTVIIRRKGGRSEEFPLLPDVGQAVADYLQVRPPVPGTRTVFVTTVAPRRPMSRQGIGAIVRTASARAGRPAGPHHFRHLLGGTLLDAGATLADIAGVLGHRDLSVTSAYVTPGWRALAALARPWPGEGGHQ
jgi:integrase/recombinase XerD